MSTQPYRNVAYGLSEPLLNVAQAPIITQRDPTTKDRAQLGTEWINQSTDNIFILVKVEDNISTWIQIGGGGGTITFDADSGSAVPSGGIITMAGAGDVSTSASGSTVTFTGAGVETVHTDSGNATVSGNAISIDGGNNISTSGSGSTITVNVSGTSNHQLQVGNASGSLTSLGLATNGQLPIGSTGLNPVLATLTAGAGVNITNGSGSITIAALGSVPLTFDADSGTAVPAGNTIIIAGGTGITTSASGSTVTVTATGGTTTFDGDSGTATPSAGVITMHGTGDITTSAAGSTVTFAGSGVTTVHTGSGNATAAANAITIAGGTGITTAGSGSTVTITATGASGIVTINGNSGSVTGSTVTLTTGASNANGTALFTGSSTTMTMTFDNAATHNLGLGTSALSNGSLSGANITALGYKSGLNNTTGASNTFLGSLAGASVTTGGSCIYIGEGAGVNGGATGVMTGSNNVILGVTAAVDFTSAHDNVGIGLDAFQSMQSGAYNCGMGSGAGTAYTSTESSNILINHSGVVSDANVLRIGSATGTGNQQLNSAHVCGIQGITVTGTAVLVSASDQLGIAVSSQRFKNNIQPMNDASDVIYKLRPVTFTWNRNSAPGLKDASQDRQCGLIAEEVAQVLPQVVGFDKEGKPLNVNYGDLTSLLINEIQKLNKRIAALEAK